MRNESSKLNISIDFNQMVDLVKQLSYKEKVKLGEIIRKETKTGVLNDKTVSHLTSEKVLSKDWLSPKEDEAWKDL